jgi:hypothetical protein
MTTLKTAPAASEKILETKVLTLSLAASRSGLLPMILLRADYYSYPVAALLSFLANLKTPDSLTNRE